MTETDTPIAAELPFAPHYMEIHGARMHYLHEGEGPTILLLHGNPTWSYIWRNIIPWLVPHARCIAPDLVGMGRSDKPDIGYRFFDHAKYLEGLIDELGLDDVTIVGHDWGSALGLHWARRHPERVRAVALMEAIIAPMRWDQFPPEFRAGFRLMRAPVVGWCMLSLMNGFVEKVLPAATVRELSSEEMDHYRMPYPSVRSRRPTRAWPREIPIDGRPADVHEAVAAYNRWLQETDIPKLLLHAHPGGIIREPAVDWCRAHLPNLEVVHVGHGIHYLQEDQPGAIGEALARWFQETHVA